MTPTEHDPRRRVLLLAGQAFALGLTIAWITIPASAVFLDAFGSGLLPVTYIGAAAVGAASTWLLARTTRRRPLAAVARRLLVELTAALGAAWLLLWGADLPIVAFALLIVLPITIPVGFVFVVGQAGMLLDVRVMKSSYPRVIGGFALGFAIGGLGGPALLSLLGRTEHLLLAAAAAAAALLLLVELTVRTFPTELAVLEPDHSSTPHVSLGSLLSNRFVVLVMAVQMLSAVESQWLDFLVFDRASQRYTDAEELASFISRFVALTYGLDILFLLLVAGLLLRRFGLRYGLTANPGWVLAMVGAVIAATTVQGAGAGTVFVLVVATRVSAMVLSDGATRASVGAAYQALPSAERLAAQTQIEGLAVPVAIGCSGVVILAIDATLGTGGLVLPVLTSVALLAWIVAAQLVYRGYGANLIASLRHRVIDPAELAIDSANTLAVIDRLLDSADVQDVRLGLDTLTAAGHPELADRLERLVGTERQGVAAEALDRLVRLDPVRAGRLARRQIVLQDRSLRIASATVLGAVGATTDVPAVSDLIDDPDPEVQLAAVSALSRIGDDTARRRISTLIDGFARSASPRERLLAARSMQHCEPGPWLDRGSLVALIADEDAEVANAAVAAIRWAIDEDLGALVVGLLAARRTCAAAIEALVRGADPALRLVDDGLGGRVTVSAGVQVLLARVARDVGGPVAVDVLRRHVDHRDRDVGLAVIAALAALGPFTDSELSELASALVATDLAHATRLLRTQTTLQRQRSAAALNDALGDELQLLHRRIVAGLAIGYGKEALDRIEFQFAQDNPRAHAIALEWLDVALRGRDRAAMALLEPGLTAAERLGILDRSFPPSPAETTDPIELVRELAQDADGAWRRPWIRACALFAAAPELGPSVRELVPEGTDPTDHEGIVLETLAGLVQRAASSRIA